MTTRRLKPVIQARRRDTIELPDASVMYWPGFIDADEAGRLGDALLHSGMVAWRHDNIMLYGRVVAQPRLTAWIADPGVTYQYSGLHLVPSDWPDTLNRLRRQLESALDQQFNSVLLNQYRDGNDYMGWHRDNEKQLGAAPVIASLSLGETRNFDLRHRAYRDKGIAVQRFELQSGDLIVMQGSTQQHWQHRVAKHPTRHGTRINLSFRWTAPA